MAEQSGTVTEETRTARWLGKAKIWLRRGWPFAAGIVAAFLGVLLYSYFYPDPVPLTDSEVDQIVVDTMASATPPP